MTFEQWSRQWSGQMAKMPHWTKRPAEPLTAERARVLATLSPHELRALVAVMTDSEIRDFMLYFRLGVIESELQQIELTL